jgi:cell division protease FtsH
MKSLLKNFALIVVALFLVAGVASFATVNKTKPEEVGINRLVTEINNGQVKDISVSGDTVSVRLQDAQKPELVIKKEPGQSFSALMDNLGVDHAKLQNINITVRAQSGFGYWAGAIIPYLLPFILLVVLIFFMSRQVQGANNKAMTFGQSTAREAKPDDQNKKTFKDVAGAKEAKEELSEIVDFLRDPKKFADVGAKIPKGVLLMGSPGTGKTLLAKAVAGEANVPFFHMSGSEFVEMFVGVGASRVRDLFKKAKEHAPAIIFIDEIDAVGRKRGAGLGGSHDEREQTLNQILVEMDGFEPNLGVIIVAATNRPDVLDPALLRPGRFDRRVVIDMPDINDREEILRVHAVGKPLTEDVSLRVVAERTPGFSGADLDNLLNESAIAVVRAGRKQITQIDILKSIEKVILGPEKRGRVMTEHDKKMTAYHEGGHALVGHFLEHADPVRKVSIIGRGMAGGYTLSMPSTDTHYRTMAKFKDDIAMMLGGFVAERMIYGTDMLTTGPSSDLKKATQTVTAMVMQYGMSDKLGPRQLGDNEGLIFLAEEIHSKKNYSEKTAELIDAEIAGLLEEAKTRAAKVLTDHRAQLDALVAALMEKETIEQEEFNVIMGGQTKKADDAGEPVEIRD